MLVAAAASVIATICVAAVVIEIMTAPQPVIPGEEGFDAFGYQWSLFVATMWPVVVAFGIAELSLVLGAAAVSTWIVTSLNLASGLTAGWVMAWWLLMSVHHEAVSRTLVQWLWLISVIAATFGVAVSAATWLIARLSRVYSLNIGQAEHRSSRASRERSALLSARCDRAYGAPAGAVDASRGHLYLQR
jgi:hypothetical protein